jgi:hypothetical protein
MTRYAIDALEAHLVDDDEPRPSAAVVALAAGVTKRTVVRWRAGGLDERSADHAAIALGVHPCELWPEWWDGASDAEGAVA